MSMINGVNQSFAEPINVKKCIMEIKDKKQLIIPSGNPKAPQESFTFDYVGNEDVTQEEIFQTVGKPIVDSCLQGYNGSIFAYGQTGSGKTFTIQGVGYENQLQRAGSIQPGADEEMTMEDNKQLDKSKRGLLPRCFEYLFQQICKIKNVHNINSARGKKSARQSFSTSNLPKFDDNITDIQFDVRCSYLEIYNEQIFDLLENSQSKIQIREEKERGVYAEPCTEEKVTCIQEVLTLIQKGTRNRKIAFTNMNRESSRSHAVFTALIKTIQTLDNGEQIIKTSRFHIVDLAGSERCKETGAEGQRLKEASMINKSLTTLGAVINDLADMSSNDNMKAKSKHIRYRESKLTYLLKDSLGGNSKTVMICNVNPHLLALKETRSTLQFAQRAKMIKNQAVVNEENTSAKYWKDKFYGLLRTNSLPVNATTFENNLTLVNEQMACLNCKNQNKGDSKLLIDSQRIIKGLTQQLKEQKEGREQIQMEFNQANDEFTKLKNQMKLQLRLKEAQIKSLEDKQKNSGDSSLEIQSLKSFIEQQRQEIEMIKQQQDGCTVLASKMLKIREIELKLKEFEQNNLGQQLQQIIDHLEQSLQYFETQISSLKNDQDDTIMQDAHLNPNKTQILNDLSTMTIRRETELANLKLYYEEQLETLRNQLKLEMQRRQQYVKFFSQKSSQALEGATQEDLLNCSQNLLASNVFFNTNNLLLSQRSVNTSGTQQQENSKRTSKQAQNSQEQEQLIEQLQQLLEDCELNLKEKEAQIEIMQNDLAQIQQQLDESNKKHEQALNDKITMETNKLELESQMNARVQDLLQLKEENEELYQKIQALEKVQEDNEVLESKLRQCESEIVDLQKTNDYFTSNLIPDLQMQFQNLGMQFEKLKEENKMLKERDQSSDQSVTQQIQQLSTQIQQKDSQLQELSISLNRTIQVVDDQKTYQLNLTQKIQEDQEIIQAYKEQNEELKSQVNGQTIQIGELESLLQKLEQSYIEKQKAVHDREKELETFKKKYVADAIKYEEEIKLIQTERLQYETLSIQLQEQISIAKQESESYREQASQFKHKYETYKSLCDKQIQQQEKAIESIKRYRSTASEKSEHLDEMINKYKTEVKELREHIRERNQIIASLEVQIKTFESQKEKAAANNDQLTKMLNLERENVFLRGQLEIYKTQAEQLESKLQMQSSQFKELEKRCELLDKQNNQLLTGTDSNQKFQHLNQIKSQNNANTKQLMQIQEELRIKKKDIETLQARINDLYQICSQFGEQICKSLNLSKSAIKTKIQDNFKAYLLQDLFELIVQGYTNQKLQLETPNMVSVPVSKQSNHHSIASESSSSYISSSSSGVDENQYKILQNGLDYFNNDRPQQQNLQNRKIVLVPDSNNVSFQNQENQNMLNTSVTIQNNSKPLFNAGTQPIIQGTGNRQSFPFSQPAIQVKNITMNGSSKGKVTNFTFKGGAPQQISSKQNNQVLGGKAREPSNNRMDIDS